MENQTFVMVTMASKSWYIYDDTNEDTFYLDNSKQIETCKDLNEA